MKNPSEKTLKFLSDRVRERIKMSRDTMSLRYEQWAANEEQFKAYIPEKDADALRKANRKSGQPEYTTIEVPYSYAIAMTAHTYYTSVFLTRSPILQYSGRHGESEMSVQAVEALMDYQITVGHNLPPLFMWLFDPIKYSVGWVGYYWEREVQNVRRRKMQPRTFMGVELPGTEHMVETVEEVLGYEGNKIYNIRPQDAFPDTRVSLWNFQQGEFFGRYVELSWSDILTGYDESRYFNIAPLRRDSSAHAMERDTGSARVTTLPNSDYDTRYLTIGEGEDVVRPVVKAYELYVKCIPREWGLADGTKTEIWLITCRADDFTVFGAEPLGYYHNKFPIDVLEQEPEAYSVFSRSMLEVMKPINDAITWMLNSHMYNVRAALNNQFVYDPSMVVGKDIETPGPTRAIRLKPTAYGRDVRSALQQLQVGDVTRAHIGDMSMLADILQRVTGVNDNIMGLVNAGGRKTATEVRQSTTMGVNRLKTTCELYSAMGFSPMAQRLLQQTQQLMDSDRQYRIVGDAATFSPGFVNVSPDTIAGFYDFMPVDGTLPVDRFAQANLWQMMLAQMSKVPQVAAGYDLGRIFAWVGGLAGLRNIQQFRIQPQAPEALSQQVRAGNVIPLEAAQRDLGLPPNQLQTPQIGPAA